jgi:hypothetical protein
LILHYPLPLKSGSRTTSAKYLYQDYHVNDQATWEQAVTAAGTSYTNLLSGTSQELERLIEEIMQLKQKLVEVVLSAGSTDICRSCGGECCRFGKYHVSVLDIMAYLKTGAQPIIPDFSNHPACPYSDVSGCTMAPGYRPMTCVVFNCQQVEEQLTSEQHETLRSYERELRDSITRAACITGIRLDRALLFSCS